MSDLTPFLKNIGKNGKQSLKGQRLVESRIKDSYSYVSLMFSALQYSIFYSTPNALDKSQYKKSHSQSVRMIIKWQLLYIVNIEIKYTSYFNNNSHF